MLDKELKKLKYLNLFFTAIIVFIALRYGFKGHIKISLAAILLFLMVLLLFLNLFINHIIKLHKEHSTKIDNIFNNVSAFLVITNGEKLVNVNRSFLDFFHLKSMEDFLKTNSCICDKFLPGDGYLQKKVSENENWLEHLLHNPESIHKAKMLDLNDRECIFQVNLQKYYEDEETTYIISFENITALEQELRNNRLKDKQLMEQSRLAQMGEMISMIAHQWRQPLSAISAASGAIHFKAKRNKLDNETAEELSEKIIDYAHHLSVTIDDFRNFFKSNKEKKRVTYTELIDNVLNIVQESIENKNIRIVKDFEQEESFETYPNELKQVILNLIKNAEDILLEKQIEEPYIQLYTYKRDKKMIFEVSDNGGGVPEAVINKIFDPYFSTKTQKDGTGLGLYMSKTIIEEHCQGVLSIHNSSVGATFTIELPNTIKNANNL